MDSDDEIGDEIDVIGLEDLRALDATITDTTTNIYPDYVAIEGGYMYPYPLFAGTLTLQGYYRKPTDMTVDASVPDLPEANIFNELIVSGVCGKYGFPHLNEAALAKEYYNDNSNPPSGRFFNILGTFNTLTSGTGTVWGNRGTYY